MKPKNFPARKLLRQIEADQRNGITHKNVDDRINQARYTFTKKNRSSLYGG